jgi:hypothetical protein
MNDELDMLPPDVKAMLRAEKVRVDAPDDGRSRLAERLAVAVPAFGAPHLPPSAPPPPPPILGPSGALKVGMAKAGVAKLVFALAVTTVGGGTVAAVGAAHHARQSEQVRHVEPAPPARGARPPALAVADMADVPVARDIAPAPSPVANVDERASRQEAVPRPREDEGRTTKAPSRPGLSAQDLSPAASLGEERRLLDAARDAIVRGEPETALASTAAHAARFPDGVLSEERDALRIRALARLGKKADAQGLLMSMRAKYPNSFLLEGAATDVDTIP